MNNDLKRKRKLKVSIVVGVTLFTLILGGCIPMDQVNDNEQDNKYNETTNENGTEDMYVSVNEYTGEGFRLREGERNDPIAKEKFDEIAEATKTFFLEEYKTEVIVHNAVGAIDGVMVIVESVGEPHFHTYAMVPVDAQENKIFIDDIWTDTMQVEQSLFCGLLAMIMEEEFAVLDRYLEELVEKFPIVGMQQEAINKTKKTGYRTPYYFTQSMALREELNHINALYMENPNISAKELKHHFDIQSYEAELFSISISLYMKESGTEPDDEIFAQIIKDIKSMEGIPRGAYSISLHDNYVHKFSATGNNDNTLRKGNPNKIIIE